jgi:hypothetical protein
MVRKPEPPSDRPFHAETVVVSPSETSREMLAGADQVAPAGGAPVSTS